MNFHENIPHQRHWEPYFTVNAQIKVKRVLSKHLKIEEMQQWQE